MKYLKMVMLFVGILAFSFGAYNIVFTGFPNQWFGFISGGYLIWLYFNIDKFVKKEDKD